jgi:hypothetical protein
LTPEEKELFIKVFRCYPTKFLRPIISKLHIDDGFPIAHRNKDGIIYAIQLRKIKDERSLLIGCGNCPTPFCYSYDIKKEKKNTKRYATNVMVYLIRFFGINIKKMLKKIHIAIKES